MPSVLANIGRELLWLDPSAVGLVVALFLVAITIAIYLYLRNRRDGLLWRLKASIISALLSGTVAVPFLYFLSNCVGYCGF